MSETSRLGKDSRFVVDMHEHLCISGYTARKEEDSGLYLFTNENKQHFSLKNVTL